jgi:hypothetical protein
LPKNGTISSGLGLSALRRNVTLDANNERWDSFKIGKGAALSSREGFVPTWGQTFHRAHCLPNLRLLMFIIDIYALLTFAVKM